jgi:thiamine pyrophosphate-dependent acetolactate synthase large subunit-like protein
MLIPEVDFAGLGRALGAEAAIVRTLEDLDSLADWVRAERDGVFVVDCRVSPTVVAPYQEEIIAAASKR